MRVKVYRADRGYGQNGVLDSVVAGPETLGDSEIGLDLAVDSTGRVLVLDPGKRTVRVFVKVQEVAKPPDGERP